MRAREYAGPLGVLAAGVIGISLLCSVSALAMGDLSKASQHTSITIEPLNVLDLAVANFETAAALTEQAVTAYVPTETLVFTETLNPSPIPSDTSTPRRYVTVTPTGTRRARSTFTPTKVPTSTPRPPSRTPLPPTRTHTPEPPPPTITDTPIPPPTDTDTPVPITPPTTYP